MDYTTFSGSRSVDRLTLGSPGAWPPLGSQPSSLQYGNPDFVKYANSYGTVVHRVTSADTLRSTLPTVHETPDVHVVEVPVDYADSDGILN